MTQVTEQLQPLIVQLLQGVLIALGALASAAISYGVWYIKKKMDADQERDAERTLIKNTIIAKTGADQTKVEPAKAANAASGGEAKLTDTQATEIKTQVMDDAMKMTGEKKIAVLQRARGDAAVAKLIDATLEAAVSDSSVLNGTNANKTPNSAAGGAGSAGGSS